MTLDGGRLHRHNRAMGPFLIAGLIGAGLAACGASLGESWARAEEKNRRKFALIGALLAVWSGIFAFLLLVATDVPVAHWDILPIVAMVWAVHGVLVSAAASVGVLLAYQPRRSERVWVGPLVACLLVSPVTCMPLLFLMCC